MAHELKELLDELELRIEKLKIKYEQYFMGIEKREPLQDRQKIARLIRRMQTTVVHNTAIKFRLHQLIQRFQSFQNYWNRIQRQIENGTYVRDLARIERDLKAKGVQVDGLARTRNIGELEAALMRSLKEEPSEPAVSAGPPPIPPDASRGARRPTGTAPPPIPGEAASAGTDRRLQSLYQAYLKARKHTGEGTEGITYDRLVRTLQKQVPAIQQRTGCRHVDFKVEIKEGKTVLKAMPKK